MSDSITDLIKSFILKCGSTESDNEYYKVYGKYLGKLYIYMQINRFVIWREYKDYVE